MLADKALQKAQACQSVTENFDYLGSLMTSPGDFMADNEESCHCQEKFIQLLILKCNSNILLVYLFRKHNKIFFYYLLTQTLFMLWIIHSSDCQKPNSTRCTTILYMNKVNVDFLSMSQN